MPIREKRPAPGADDSTVVALSRADLLDLLTTAALLGRNDSAVRDASTRGDVTGVVARAMRSTLAALPDASRRGRTDGLPRR